MAKKFNDEQIEEIAQLFGLLQEPTRLKILILLRERPHNVSEITERLEMRQANTSRHLSLLLRAGILKREKIGVERIYSVAEAGIFQLCELVCGQVKSKAQRKLKKIK
jgi:DNA-binding transcriptional ArsR family regulator